MIEFQWSSIPAGDTEYCDRRVEGVAAATASLRRREKNENLLDWKFVNRHRKGFWTNLAAPSGHLLELHRSLDLGRTGGGFSASISRVSSIVSRKGKLCHLIIKMTLIRIEPIFN